MCLSSSQLAKLLSRAGVEMSAVQVVVLVGALASNPALWEELSKAVRQVTASGQPLDEVSQQSGAATDQLKDVRD